MKKLTKKQQEKIRFMHLKVTNSRIKADQAENLLAKQYEQYWTGSSWKTGLERKTAEQYMIDAIYVEELREEHYRCLKRFRILNLTISEEEYPEYKGLSVSLTFSDSYSD